MVLHRSAKSSMLAVYSLLHFLVDFSGIFFIAAHVRTRLAPQSIGQDFTWILLILAYNFLAFALPALLGLLADIWRHNAVFAAFGLCLLSLGYLACLTGFPTAVSVALIGAGNGMFHVGGGVDVLESSPERFAPAGIFISTGALGVYLGNRVLPRNLSLMDFVLSLVLFACALCLWKLPFLHGAAGGRQRPAQPLRLPGLHASFLIPAAALFIVVCIRSYYGTILLYPWAADAHMALLLVLCLAAGKMSGGILADRIGVPGTILSSLGLAAILSLFSFGAFSPPLSILCGLLSIFFFNMTMPLTLVLLSRLFQEAKGFAFGLLTLALFIGSLPRFAGSCRLYRSIRSPSLEPWNPAWFSPAGLFLLCLLSMSLLFLGIRLSGGTKTVSADHPLEEQS